MLRKSQSLIINLLIWLSLGVSAAGQNGSPFYRGSQGLTSTEIFSFDYEKVTHTVQLVADASGDPLCYYARLHAPVCEDSVCQILNLDMYWDLLGNYMAFDTIPGYPLTKYQHAKFTSEDYQELHTILQNDYSPLKDLQMSDLINNDSKLASESIDAISGATSIYVADAVVKGAVYSCFILWHIANSQTEKKIMAHTASIMTPHLQRQMLETDNTAYRLYTFSQFGLEEYQKNVNAVNMLLSSDDSETISYLLTNIPLDILSEKGIQLTISTSFYQYNVTDRYKILERYAACACMSSTAIEILSRQISLMSYMQVQLYAEILLRQKSIVSEQTIDRLKAECKKKDFKYAFLLEEFLNLEN